MSNISLATVKDCDSIFTNGHDVLVGGKNLWIFRANGTFVAKYKTIRNPDKAVFLPGNTVLVNGHGDGSYHYISLDDGKLLWSSVKKAEGMLYRADLQFLRTEQLYMIYAALYPAGFTLIELFRKNKFMIGMF